MYRQAEHVFTRAGAPTKEPSDYQRLVFVVHKHQATTLHENFRMEIGGVMRTSAIPRGPTLDPHHKRLAMPTPDHSLDYRHFEGVLEEGQYGAGPVLVWGQAHLCARARTGQRCLGRGDRAGRS